MLCLLPGTIRRPRVYTKGSATYRHNHAAYDTLRLHTEECRIMRGVDIRPGMVYARFMERCSPSPALAVDVETVEEANVYESPYKTTDEWLAALEGEDLAEAKALLGVEGELDVETRWGREVPVAEFHDGQVPLFKGQGALSAEQFARQVQVDTVLDRLPLADRDLLERRLLEGMTLEQIAQEDGTTYQAIQQRLDTATRRFKRVWHETVGDEWTSEQ